MAAAAGHHHHAAGCHHPWLGRRPGPRPARRGGEGAAPPQAAARGRAPAGCCRPGPPREDAPPPPRPPAHACRGRTGRRCREEGERRAREGRRRPLVGMDPWEGVLANRKPSFQRIGLLTWRVVFFYDLILYFWIGKWAQIKKCSTTKFQISTSSTTLV